MKDGCLKPEEIAGAQLAAADDPRRLHLESCSRCGALAASLDLFRSGDDLPDVADMADAERRLADFLEREVEREVEREPERQPSSRMGLSRKHRRRSYAPVLWAAAAVLAVAVGLPFFIGGDAEQPGGILLRDGGDFSPANWSIHEPEMLTDGGTLLTWDPVDGATGYRILLLDGRQQEAGTLDAGAMTELVLAANGSGLLVDRPRPWYFRVVARDRTGELMRSLPRLLPALSN